MTATNRHPSVDPRRLKKLLMEMVDIYSPTGKESGIVDFLRTHLRDFPLVLQEVDDERSNVLILPREEPAVVFVGHIDTVPAPDYDSYESGEEGDSITGLGTADMKGGCAAMIEAFISYHERNEILPAALALVVGEEETGDGIQALLDEYHFSWAVVGEPTDLVPCLGHYGYIEMSLTTTGPRVHASVATPDNHAVRDMLTILLLLINHFDNRHREISYNIRDVFSSLAGFATPEWCEARIDLHIPPRFPTGELASAIEELISGSLADGKRPEDILTFSTIHDGYQLTEKGLLPEILRDVFDRRKLSWKTGIFRSDSDANLLWQGGVKPVILGPGRLEMAHSPDEQVDFPQVIQAAEIYLEIVTSLGSLMSE